MVDLTQYLGPDGVSIRWERVGAVLSIAGLFALVEGWVRVFFATVGIPVSILDGLGNFTATWYETVLALPAVILERGFVAAVPFVQDAGIAGFVAAITITLLTILPIAWVVNRIYG